MDREKHELFHSWLRWKKEKSGYYPRFKDQIRILRDEYGGMILSEITLKEKNAFGPVIAIPDLEDAQRNSVWKLWREEPEATPKPIVPAIREYESEDIRPSPRKQVLTNDEAKPQSKIIPKAVIVETLTLKPEQRKKLFVLLREERSRLAQERNLKAYMIFHDKTLNEMSERLPDSKHAMFEIGGVTQEKYETYGAQFIAVIRKFKEDLDEEK
jgi:hypothetical protein